MGWEVEIDAMTKDELRKDSLGVQAGEMDPEKGDTYAAYDREELDRVVYI